jgi:RNA polymerase sigma-70 factor (ECF subfamily)
MISYCCSGEITVSNSLISVTRSVNLASRSAICALDFPSPRSAGVNCVERTPDRITAGQTNQLSIEQELLAAAMAGSTEAFEKLFRLYKAGLYRITYAITRNREDAEDAVQDAFLRAYLSLENFRGDSRFYSWVVRIAVNSSLMLLRKQRTRRELPMEGVTGTDGNTMTFDVIDARPGPAECYDHLETHASLMKAIQDLPAHLRAVAVLRLLRERSTDETGEALGLSEAAIKSRLFRIRVRLAKTHGFEYRSQEN